jgi:hypothetical protein
MKMSREGRKYNHQWRSEEEEEEEEGEIKAERKETD